MHHHPPLVLGLDLGTTRCKALLIDPTGAEVASSTVVTPFRRTQDRVEMEVDALQGALRRVVTALGDARRHVMGVGVAGMAESGAPLDRAGSALAPVIAWHDPRGTETVAVLGERFGDELPRRLGQRLRTVSSVAKLGWVLASGATGVHRWLGVPELCLFALTGAQATDHSLAARTGCYDIARRAWWPDVPDTLGIANGIFPPLRRAGAVLGRVSRTASSWSGLPIDVPVTLAGHDHLAALSGSGALAGDFGNSVGTAESVVAFADELPDVDRALALRVALSVRPDGDGWALLAGAARAGRVIETVAGLLGRSPVDLDTQAVAAGDQMIDASELMAAILEDRQVEAPTGAPGEVWNGVLHALARRTGEAIGRAAALVGPPSRLVVFGGGSRSRPWLRWKAGVGTRHGVAVWRSCAGEAAARGAALQAGVAAGWWSSPAEAPSTRSRSPRRSCVGDSDRSRRRTTADGGGDPGASTGEAPTGGHRERSGTASAGAGRAHRGGGRAAALVGPPSRLVVFGSGSRSTEDGGRSGPAGLRRRRVAVLRRRQAAGSGAALQAGHCRLVVVAGRGTVVRRNRLGDDRGGRRRWRRCRSQTQERRDLGAGLTARMPAIAPAAPRSERTMKTVGDPDVLGDRGRRSASAGAAPGDARGLGGRRTWATTGVAGVARSRSDGQLSGAVIERTIMGAKMLAQDGATAQADARRKLLPLISRVEVHAERVDIYLFRAALVAGNESPAAPPLLLSSPARIVKGPKEVRLVVSSAAPSPGDQRDPSLIKLIARAWAARRAIEERPEETVEQIAASQGYGLRHFRVLLRIAYLAPEITTAILEGRQPLSMTREKIVRMSDLPLDWKEQAERLGFPAAKAA